MQFRCPPPQYAFATGFQTTRRGLLLKFFSCMTGHIQSVIVTEEGPERVIFRQGVPWLLQLPWKSSVGHFRLCCQLIEYIGDKLPWHEFQGACFPDTRDFPHYRQESNKYVKKRKNMGILLALQNHRTDFCYERKCIFCCFFSCSLSHELTEERSCDVISTLSCVNSLVS